MTNSQSLFSQHCIVLFMKINHQLVICKRKKLNDSLIFLKMKLN